MFKKTNIHAPAEVNRSLEIAEQWLQVLNNDGKMFPSNFDYHFFNKALEMLLDYEHAITTPKCLWFLYKTFHIYPIHQQKTLAKLIFKDRFGKLFFNWSWNIRTVYMKLYLYQLFHVYGQGATDKQAVEDGESSVRRMKSSNNLRFVKMQIIEKNMAGNATTINKSSFNIENGIIKEIVKIAEHRHVALTKLVREYKDNNN